MYKILKTCLRWVGRRAAPRVLPLTVGAGLTAPAFAALLGVTLTFPLITYDNQGTTTYDEATDRFFVNASPLAIRLAPTVPPVLITAVPGLGETLVINATVDDTGALTGGVSGDDLLVVGEVDLGATGFFSGFLLTGEVTGFGFQDSGGSTDSYDFTFTVTGGLLAFLYPSEVGVTVSSEQSDFTGDFTVNFGGEAKGTLGAIPPVNAALGDRVWEDQNVNGIQDCEDTNGNGILGDVDQLDPGNPAVSDQGPECGDSSSGGAGIAGVPVNLFQPDENGDCTIDLGTQVITGADGLYLFPDLEPGDYCVQFGQPPADFCDTDGFALGAPQFTALNVGADPAIDSDADPATGTTDGLTLAAGETNRTLDAGIVCPAKIGDRVWEDTDQDGLQDGEESGVEGVTVRLFECGPDGVAGTGDDVDTGESRVTDAIDGLYMFGAEPGVFDLGPGDYYVKFDPTSFPPGFDFTVPKVGSDDTIDSDCLPPNGITACTTLGSRGINLNRDCGIIPPPPNCDLELDKKCRVETPPVSGDLECEAKIAASVLEYTGPGTPSVVTVTGKDKNSQVVSSFDAATGILTVDARPGDLGSKMTITTDGVAEVIHTSCSAPYVAGQPAPLDNPKGDPSANWLVLSFVDKNGGSASVPGDANGMFTDNCTFTPQPQPSCDTVGKPTSLTFKYTGGACPGDNDQGSKADCSGSVNGSEMATISVNTGDDYSVSPMAVNPNGLFTITRGGQDFKSNTDIDLSNTGGTQVNDVHTSCSAPLAVGDEFGAITLVAINGQTGGVDVTYQYVVTNNGDPLTDIVVTDVPLGDVGTIGFLGTGDNDTLTLSTSIDGTTVNTGTASGTLEDSSVCSASDTVTVEAVIPPCVVTPGEFKLDDDKIKWKLTNAGDKVATVESIELSAPNEFGEVKKVKLDGDIFKDDTRPMTWTFTDADFINDLKNRQIKVGDTKELTFETTEKFKTATADQISITVNFKEGCSVTFVPGAQAFVCKDAKPIDSLSMIWNGDVPVTVSAAGQSADVTVPGQEVSFSGLSGMGNDVEWTISGAENGISTFHVSCSDDNMNGPEDCGSAQGNGKKDDKGLNLWLFEGMAGSNGIGFDCSVLP